MPPPLSGSAGGCPAVWSISHYREYSSRECTVQSPHPCGSSCGAPHLDRRPPPGLCTGSPVTGCCYGPRYILAGLGPAALGYCPCCWPVGSAGSPQCARPWGCGLLFPFPHQPSVCGTSTAIWRLFTGVRACRILCVPCAMSWGSWLLFTGVPAQCVVLRVRCPAPVCSCSLLCPLHALCCMCGVLGHLAPVDWYARSVHCIA